MDWGTSLWNHIVAKIVSFYANLIHLKRTFACLHSVQALTGREAKLLYDMM